MIRDCFVVPPLAGLLAMTENSMSPKIFFVACEPSGDLHGSHLAKEIRKISPQADLMGLGGPQMQAAGVRTFYDMTQVSALGFGDVLRLYFHYRKIFYQTLKEIEDSKPDVIVVIDSPAFNLRLAKKISAMNLGGPAAKSGGKIPVIYYISPQIWAWGGRRIHTIKKTISKMLTILPFEKAIYDQAGVPCEFVGHPLLDEIPASQDKAKLRRELGIERDEIAIGLLPGSRESEVRRILPCMLEAASLIKKEIPKATFYLLESQNVPKSVYEKIVAKLSSPGLTGGSIVRSMDPRFRGDDIALRRFHNKFHDVAASMDFALITSGTATLEAALSGTPFFLLYKASWSTYFLGRMLVKVPYLGMANLLLNKPVVPEFIQFDMKASKIAEKAIAFLKNPSAMQRMKDDFSRVRKILGEGNASERAAKAVMAQCSQANSGNTTGSYAAGKAIGKLSIS